MKTKSQDDTFPWRKLSVRAWKACYRQRNGGNKVPETYGEVLRSSNDILNWRGLGSVTWGEIMEEASKADDGLSTDEMPTAFEWL